MCLLYNDDKQSIEINITDKEKEKYEEYSLDNYPVELCEICKCELTIGNCYYSESDNSIKFNCSECCKDNSSFAKLENGKSKNYQKKVELLSLLNSYLEKNKLSSNEKCVNEMEKLIKITTNLLYILDLLELKKSFNKQVIYLRNFRNNFLSYFEIVAKLQMNNLFLFLKNIFVISLYNYEKNWLLNNVVCTYKNKAFFNIPEIQFYILKNIFDKTFGDSGNNNYKVIKNEIKILKEFDYKTNLIALKFQLNDLKFNISDNKLLAFRSEIKVRDIKAKLEDHLRNYCYSYHYVSYKKTMERQLINSIIFILLKNHYNLFDPVKLNENLANSLKKELKDILEFLVNYPKNSSLSNKIKKEIKYFETFKNSKDYKDNNKFIFKETGGIVFLTKEEKEILKNYYSRISEESYTSIYAAKEIKNPPIESLKLQIILDFLFYLRDKTINIIHILEKNALSFFEYLNQKPSKNSEEEKESKNLINIEGDKKEDKAQLEEMKYYIPPKRSNNAKKINSQLLSVLKVNPRNEIDSYSAFDYIFFYKTKENYNKEIQYMYQNFVLPLNQIVSKSNDTDSLKRNNWNDLKNKVQYLYDKLDNQIKKDPNYNNIINYLDKCDKNKKNVSKEMQFYEKYVEDFQKFKELHRLSIETEEQIKTIDETYNNIDKLRNIIEKYEVILEKVKEHLNFNKEKYSKYYSEWQKKNYALPNYSINHLLNDLKKLIPKKEKIKIAGNDKINFTLILWIFQNNYFLKDYI